MTRRICATTILVLLLAMTPVAPRYAVAEPPVPNWANKDVLFDAVLYETTENLSLRALKKQERRKATSSLLGFARVGSPLCPVALVLAAEADAQFCTLNATGSDNISLDTGLGTFSGDVELTIQEVVGGTITPDSPEVVIAKGRFTGKMNFSPAILFQIPLGSVDGQLSLNGFSKRVPFTGVFRLPFLFPPVFGDASVYLLNPPIPIPFDTSTWVLDKVADNEMAIGYPAVRFEISFP
jgi:hypothetical protein